jgi:hypothetical protein
MYPWISNRGCVKHCIKTGLENFTLKFWRFSLYDSKCDYVIGTTNAKMVPKAKTLSEDIFAREKIGWIIRCYSLTSNLGENLQLFTNQSNDTILLGSTLLSSMIMLFHTYKQQLNRSLWTVSIIIYFVTSNISSCRVVYAQSLYFSIANKRNHITFCINQLRH